MKPRIQIEHALADKHLLGAALGDQSTWLTWTAVLKAAYARPLSADERAAFDRVAGGRAPPARKVQQLAVLVSRRGGKGRAASALATFESALVDHSAQLAPGETGVIAVISPTRAQSAIVRDYVLGFLEASSVLRTAIEETTADEIRLKSGVVIATLANDFRTLRGRTLLLAILDEAAFLRDETSSTPDIEAARALLPGLATTGGMLVVLSSPYRRAGLLYTLHRDFYGRDSDDVLVVAGASIAFNPTLDERLIAAARAADPQAALSEWDGEFRSGLSQFLDDASIDAAVDNGRPLELPPCDGVDYRAFTDASAGRHDAFTIAICHRENERIITDVVRGRRAPFDPASVAAEYAGLARQYGCGVIVGDNYAPGWVSGAFTAAGCEYQKSPLTRSELYIEGLPLFTRGLVSIPPVAILLRELRLLERRTARSGKDSVDHGTGGSDDFANSLFGALHLAAKRDDVVVTGGFGVFSASEVEGLNPAAAWSAEAGYGGGVHAGGFTRHDHKGWVS
jgi:hypothetical protein